MVSRFVFAIVAQSLFPLKVDIWSSVSLESAK